MHSLSSWNQAIVCRRIIIVTEHGDTGSRIPLLQAQGCREAGQLTALAIVGDDLDLVVTRA